MDLSSGEFWMSMFGLWATLFLPAVLIGILLMSASIFSAGAVSSYSSTERDVVRSFVRAGVYVILGGALWPLLPAIPLFWFLRGFWRVSGAESRTTTWMANRRFQADQERKERIHREREERDRQERLLRDPKAQESEGALSFPESRSGAVSLCNPLPGDGR